MKEITHFAAGIAAASCFPFAVEAGRNGNPLYFILGGCFGLLPEILDARFSRCFHRHDITVTPDPAEPDARMIADAVALAVNTACETGNTIRMKLNTIRLNSCRWRRYSLRFNVKDGTVEVAYGPVVGYHRQETETAAPGPHATSVLDCGIRLEHTATTVVDIPDGPSFRMAPCRNETVLIGLIPVHHEWSHSLAAGLVSALIAGWIWNLNAMIVAFCGYGIHLLLDHPGSMGGHLLYPFRRKQTRGRERVKPESPLLNSMFAWSCALLLFWNLSASARNMEPVNPLTLIFYGLLLPLAACRAISFSGERRP